MAAVGEAAAAVAEAAALQLAPAVLKQLVAAPQLALEPRPLPVAKLEHPRATDSR